MLPLCTRTCPECGETLITKKGVPEEREGELVEVNQSDLRLVELEKLWAIARRRGYTPGWVYYRYKEKFGEAPHQYQSARRQPRVNSKAFEGAFRKAARKGRRLDWDGLTKAAFGGGKVA